MALVLAVSSFVARGTVGLRAILPAFDRLGRETIACPTILLSNHLGHPRAEGGPVPPETFAAVLDGLEANGWLAGVAAVQTGYLPSAEHVAILADAIARLRRRTPQALVVCDPVLGDAPHGLYVPAAAAAAVRARLVPLATHIKPNPFELAFLSGRSAATPEEVVAAARALPVPVVLASSVPLPGDRLANVVVTAERAALCAVDRVADAPHGTGDLLTALFAAHCLDGESPFTSAAFAAAGVARAIALSRGTDELALAGPTGWHEAPPLPLTEL